MTIHEYLLSYGKLGDFGRFRPTGELIYRRGDRAVIRSHRGLELGTVLCPAQAGHAQFLPNTTVGYLLRRATPEDENVSERQHLLAQRVFGEACDLSAELNLPLQILDVEVLLDGEHAAVHLRRTATCDVRPLVSGLSRSNNLHVILEDLTGAAGSAGPDAPGEVDPGCGRLGCGRTTGGCSSCGSGDGCGTCGVTEGRNLHDYFSELRQKIPPQRHALM
jgi:hypothetical protein